MKIEFGALFESCTLNWQGGQVEPLPTREEVMRNLSQPLCSYQGWIYPPPYKSGKLGELPLMPDAYSLDATHILTLDGDDAEKANFIIALLGMLKGVRLQRPDWTHFYRTPLKRKLNDFVASNTEIEKTLQIASAFWDKHDDENIRKLAFGALHWHLFAQLYQYEFERFNGQYAAFDACSKLAVKLKIVNDREMQAHSKRSERLCAALNVPLPEWSNALSERRNALVHEAIYAGQPIGFAAPNEFVSMESDLTGLVARIYLRLLGVNNEYTSSSCTTQQTLGFSYVELNGSHRSSD